MKRAVFALAFGLLWGCESEPASTPAPTAPPPAPSAPAPPAPPPATPKTTATFASSDGAALSGDLFLSADASAPSVVLIHRLTADKGELDPLAQRLAVAPKRYTVLNFDLRGHGSSKAPKQEKVGETKSLSKDVDAAIAHLVEVTHDKTRGIVLVGSSLGATLASEVAFAQPKVTALALLSPGAAISGHDIYRPYAEVRNIPTFLAGAKDDTVSRDPLDSLEKMAMTAVVKRYDGSRHSAGLLAEEHSELWQDVENWLMTVYDVAPQKRQSLYRAPKQEPAKPAAKAGAAAPKGAN